MKNVLLFTDPGIDDSLAIIYSILHREIHLVGIVAGYGNVEKEQSVQNVTYLLELANIYDIPVIRGAEGTISGEVTVFYPEIHGPQGLGPIRPPASITTKLEAFNEIFNIIKTYENNLTIVDVGRNTSLSISFILEPEILKKVTAFYLMGGAFLVPGNATSVAEANVFGDPIATRNVLDRAKNIRYFPLNVTNYAYVKKEMAAMIQRFSQNSYQELVPKVIEYYIDAYQKLVPGIAGAPLHDVLTVSALVNPKVCSYVEKAVTVNAEGPAIGLTYADFRNRPEQKQPKTPSNMIRIAIQLDYTMFYQDFLKTMTLPLTATQSNSNS